MKKNIKNANMVEIANARIMSIYESIMSEGILGALGGAAIGSALGAGAAAVRGDSFDKLDVVKTAGEHADGVTSATKNFGAARSDLEKSLSKTIDPTPDIQQTASKLNSKLDSISPTPTDFNSVDNTALTSSYKGSTGVLDSPVTTSPYDTNKFTLTGDTTDGVTKEMKTPGAFAAEPKQFDANLDKNIKAAQSAQSKLDKANKNYTTTDKALNWASKNHIAAGAAVGGTVGGAIGAFAHDDHKDEGDDEVLEDDDRLF